MRAPSLSRDFVCTVGALLVLILWEWGGQDMAMAAWFGTPHGFPLEHSWLLEGPLHVWGRNLAWGIFAALLLQCWRPYGFLRALPRSNRVAMVGSIFAALLLISLLKRASPTSCPWDLQAFGGAAQHLPHWRALLLRLPDGGGGHCFPAGSASSGFAFVAAYPFLRQYAPRAARLWLMGFAAAGLVLGLAQQVRGAHFMSHTLWTAWLCWTCGMALFWLRAALAQVGGQKEKTAA